MSFVDQTTYARVVAERDALRAHVHRLTHGSVPMHACMLCAAGVEDAPAGRWDRFSRDQLVALHAAIGAADLESRADWQALAMMSEIDAALLERGR